MMDFLEKARLIQGGMGAYVSNWRLARAVARERPGTAVGTISGTGLDIIYVRLLQIGDPGGHVRSALAAFDAQFGTTLGREICAHYFIDGGKAPTTRFQSAPMQVIRAQDGSTSIPPPGRDPAPVALALNEDAIKLLIVSGFAETWLAKQGHDGKVFINFLAKIELPLVYSLYGAMLAGVDGVIVGAGNPDGLPAVCSRLARHQPVGQS
jgi:NAD(P)H-dependent flavin oxidoreductase YrpB (nitropropane dioxygenase family)